MVLKFIHERVYVYSLKGYQPGPTGWKARDFSEGKQHIWAGILKVTTTTDSDKGYVVLEHDKKDAGKTGVFAQCEATNDNVERVVDSSRFYVLKISNGQGKCSFYS